MDPFSSMTIQQLSIQFLETTYILDNSKNTDTIQSRVQFLETVVERLKPLSTLSDYQFYAQIGIDDYKVRYLNRIPTEDNISGLLNPIHFNFEDYCIKTIISGLQRYLSEQYEELEFLKSKGSKDKRLSTMIHSVLMVKSFLEMKFSTSNFYSSAVKEIEPIIIKIKEYHETI